MTCRFCGKQIRRTHEGFWGTTDPNDGHPWYRPDDLGDDKRHEAALEPVDSGRDYVAQRSGCDVLPPICEGMPYCPPTD